MLVMSGRGALTSPICHVRGAVCLHCQFVPYGTWCAYVAHLSCPGHAMRLHRPFVMFERGAPAPPICHVRGTMCIRPPICHVRARCACTAHLSCPGAMRIRRPFVMSERGAHAPPICHVRDAVRLRVAVGRDAFAQIACARRMIQIRLCKAALTQIAISLAWHAIYACAPRPHKLPISAPRRSRTRPAAAADAGRRRATPRTARLRVCSTRYRFLTAMRPAAAHVPHGIASARVALRPCLSHGASIALFAGCALALRFGCSGGWDM